MARAVTPVESLPTFPVAAPAPAQVRLAKDLSHNLAAGTVIPAELGAVLDSSAGAAGFIEATVSEDVKGSDGRVALPAGSALTVMVRESDKKGPESRVVLGLYSVYVQGNQYSLSDGHRDAATVVFTEDAGKGFAHNAVHLTYGTRMDFKLDSAVSLR